MQQNHLVIHAGSHKTGSSAIQRYLFDHQSRLGATHFLNRGKPNASPWMLQSFKQDFASLPAIQLLYVYRMFYPSQAEQDRRVVSKLKQLCGKPLRFHSELYEELIVLTREEEARFEERAGFSIAENLQADDDIAIRCEEDLLAIPERSVAWLSAQSDSGRAMAKPDLQGIASLVALLGMQAP